MSLESLSVVLPVTARSAAELLGMPGAQRWTAPLWNAEGGTEGIRRDAGLEALCRSQLLNVLGRPDAALERLNEALRWARASGDDTLLLLVLAERARRLEAEGRVEEHALARQHLLEAATHGGLLDASMPGLVQPLGPLGGGPAAARSPAIDPEPLAKDAGAATGGLVRIRTLGAFSVTVDGRPLARGRKIPHKPLALLQLLVAHGSTNVAATVAVNALWPDADGGCGRRALDVALLRLRRLLGHEDAVVVSGGRLSIDPRRCWIDVRAFDAAVDAVDRGAVSATADQLHHLAGQVTTLYEGRFLGTEDDQPWMLSARDRYAAKFARALATCARALAATGDLPAAEALYRRGLELDNLSEPLYRGLMECCAAQGHPSEAITAYRRCRDLLSIVLNTRPSQETDALYRRLSAG